MRRRRVTLGPVALALAAAVVAAAACSDGNNNVNTAGAGDASPFVPDGGVIIDGSIQIDASADAGGFSVVDVPDTPCVPAGGATRDVYAADATIFRPLRAVPVGARLAMETDDGFVLMDGDGSNASAQPVTTPFAISGTGSTPGTLLALGGTTQTLSVARFDAAGTPQGTFDVASRAGGSSAVGGGEGTALVAFLSGTELRARGFTEGGAPAGGVFTFRQGVGEIEATAFDVAHASGAEYGVAFVGQGGGMHRLVFTRVSTTARVGTSFTLLFGDQPLRLVQLAKVGQGFAILLERRSKTGETEVLLVRLDGAGQIAGPVLRLLGTMRAFGVASSKGEIGVLAWRARAGADPDEPVPDAVEFRPFSAAGEALGGWVCVGPAFPSFTADVGAAIVGDDVGYRVLARTPARAVTLTRFDRLGTGG